MVPWLRWTADREVRDYIFKTCLESLVAPKRTLVHESSCSNPSFIILTHFLKGFLPRVVSCSVLSSVWTEERVLISSHGSFRKVKIVSSDKIAIIIAEMS